MTEDSSKKSRRSWEPTGEVAQEIQKWQMVDLEALIHEWRLENRDSRRRRP